MLMHRGIQYIKMVVFQIDSTTGWLPEKNFFASYLTSTQKNIADGSKFKQKNP